MTLTLILAFPMAPRNHYTGRKLSPKPVRLLAAQYVRMSTSHQRYSIENQKYIIAQYAQEKGIEIVRTYSDAAKSGLYIAGRTGLQALIKDVQEGRADFNLILVFDISRWGRFQDTDESAHYEFICKNAGISIRYCAEQFDNSGSLFDNLLKHMKRTMAGEYSRDLSNRISLGHRRLASLGYHQGGVAGIGLRRVLVDANGQFKCELTSGQTKCLASDRVILAPGPDREIKIVNEIFRLFTEKQLTQRKIAFVLNARRITTLRGKNWDGEGIYRILTNEKYAGNFIYSQSTYRMLQKRIWQPHHSWIRAAGVLKPIVDPRIFSAAQRLIGDSRTISKNHLLDYLTATLCVNGYLSAQLINKLPYSPTHSTYWTHFGTMVNAYRLIGYKFRNNYHYNAISGRLRRFDREITAKLISHIERCGRQIELDGETGIFTLDKAFTFALVLVPYSHRPKFSGWKLFLGKLPSCDAILMGRLDSVNNSLLDFHLLPRRDFRLPTFRFTKRNISQFAQYKHSMSNFYSLVCERFPTRTIHRQT